MEHRTCTKCLLDTSDTCISFDKDGVCNYCREYQQKEKAIITEKQREGRLKELVTVIKKNGRGRAYDCIVGLSGGLDSSYLLYYAKQLGLNPLAVHYDCGWNTGRAVKNIESLVTSLHIDLYTYVVDWEEFRDVQLAYLKAGVVDLEIPTDHSFMAALYKVAAKHNIRYLLTGHNFATEGIMPRSWIYNKGDATNLKSIHKKFGTIKTLYSFPIVSLGRKFYYYNILGIRNCCILNYIDYNKANAKKVLADSVGWQAHPVKHGESIWTRFYQCYILPTRFGIDKRKAHLSNLICSGQLDRAAAVEQLGEPVYDEEMLKNDTAFILNKFNISPAQLEDFIRQPKLGHDVFGTDKKLKKWYNDLRHKFPFAHRKLKTSNHW